MIVFEITAMIVFEIISHKNFISAIHEQFCSLLIIVTSKVICANV